MSLGLAADPPPSAPELSRFLMFPSRRIENTSSFRENVGGPWGYHVGNQNSLNLLSPPFLPLSLPQGARMRKALSLTATMALGLMAAVSAQTVQTLPQGYLAKNGTQATSWPWNNKISTGHRCMWIYDSSHFKSTGPVMIQKLRWRSNSRYTTWVGGTHKNVTINLSTSPLDFKNASSTYAKNHGKDKTAVFKGNVTVTGSTHKNGRWYVEISLKTPFLYDPSKGDLTIDYIRPAGTVSGTMVPVDTISDSRSTWTTKSNRIQTWNSSTSATGSVGPYTAIVEVTWLPAKGLYSNFAADKTSGPGPLTVQFTDKTFTSSKGGVKSWAWDFNGDNKIDSTVQNPKWTFPKTTWDATYDVALTTTDGVFPTSKKTEKAFITVDPSTALAVNYGAGSTSTPIPTPIVLPTYKRTFSSTLSVRGFHFIAPTTLVITGFKAPNTYSTKQTNQTVTCYVLAKAPSSGYSPKAADIRFHGTGKANAVLKATKAIVVLKGQWVAILGSTHGSAANSLFRNSFGAGRFKTTVLGKPITLNGLWTNSSTRTTKGFSKLYQTSGDLGRVFVHVAGNTMVPAMTTIGLPKLGSTPRLSIQGKIPGAQGGVLLLSGGRLPAPVKTAFGNLLNKLPFYLTVLIPSGTGQIPVPIPAQSSLTGIVLNYQTLIFDLKTSTYGMTNGTEWFLGK